MPHDRPFLAFAHIGDLHIADKDPAHVQTFRAAAQQVEAVGENLAFVFLPGDIADNGLPEQYRQVRAVLDGVSLPVHVITGDHDMEGGSLDAFYAGLGARRLPYGLDVGGVRCLFLDICGPGSGGPDFRLADQVDWLAAELDAAQAAGRLCALFMHSYPADLRGEGEADRVAALIHKGPVRLVEMGHTHYNELGNDGRTIYAAARSTGQIEEGPAGYAVAAIDDGVVSWRFKEIDRPWPFVLITSPADRRLAHDADQIVSGGTTVRALVLGQGDIACALSVDDGPWQPMAKAGGKGRWEATLAAGSGRRHLRVRATAADGTIDTDAIEPASEASDIPTSKGIGTDQDAIGAWERKGILGTQLGPNRNGRKW